ncbi:hypothetical protein [Modestobacter sp. NPDC049651]|uniref:hypothetical protein n=1 Tax=unclassified Modestobacter TaxID=2643866 RepID=UPI0033F5F314
MAGHPSHPRGRAWPAGPALGAALVLGACGHGLCEAATPAADISTQLVGSWPDRDRLQVTVGCPPGDECGFLDGPVSGPGVRSLHIGTVLRPAAVQVTVTEVDTGRVRVDRPLRLDYEPVGPQTECTGAARAVAAVLPP